MQAPAFIKMHGSGNDFVVIDARTHAVAIDAVAARAIADRRTGVGCDQLIVIGPPGNRAADARMRIFNADGSEVAACGNATRCVALLLMRGNDTRATTIETMAGLLRGQADADGRISVDLGPVRTDWQEIPLARAVDTLHLPVDCGPLRDPVAVSVGNPHAVFFVEDADAVALAAHGPEIEHHPLFPQATNVEIATLAAPGRLRVRVWERGVGITPSCGTGAAAAAIAATRRGLGARAWEVVMDGGPLGVTWRPDNHVVLTGPVAVSFTGVLDPSLLGSLLAGPAAR